MEMFMSRQIGYSAVVPPMSSSDSNDNPDDARKLDTLLTINSMQSKVIKNIIFIKVA
jgi:hypothetical protein